MTIGSLFFAAPWALAALGAVPVIWWLLRILPPAPKRIRFPAIGLLPGLIQKEETPAHTPWWLLALRLMVCVLTIAALSDPLWMRSSQVAGSGRLLVVLDDGWTSASGWHDRVSAARGLVEQAERDDRLVILTGTAPRAPLLPLESGSAGDALSLLESLTPLPWTSDRAGLAARLNNMTAEDDLEPVWISSGIGDGGEESLISALTALAGDGVVRIMRSPPESLAWGLTAADDGAVRILRPGGGVATTATIEARDRSGRLLATMEAAFAAGARESIVSPDIPLGLRNRISMLSLGERASAGSVHLLDERDRRRPVALVSGDSLEATQPLLSGLHYLERALESYAEIHHAPEGGGAIADLIGEGVAVLIAADVGRFTPADREALESWIESGGILVRFAGPRLAGQKDGPEDDLIPVPLRRGDRTLGGALSWSSPQGLGAFDPDSPFYGLEIPPDVQVERQVLAEPVAELPSLTWARLSDGTPLVTARQMGEGRLVLFHVSANTDWSTLPISGLYVDMLRRIVALSAGVDGAAETGGGDIYLPPVSSLDGRGLLGPPPADALPLRLSESRQTPAGPHHPPGFYGRGGTERALNVLPEGAAGSLSVLPTFGPGAANIIEEALDGARDISLKRWLMATALAILLADGLITLWLSGLLTGLLWRVSGLSVRRGAAAMVLFAAMAGAASGQGVPGAALETRLGYVLTGEAAVDEMSRAGLQGLSNLLRARTSMEPGVPDGVDVTRDELAFYPLLYWPMVESQPAPADSVLQRIGAYMRQGGMIVFDTRSRGRDFGTLTDGSDPGTEALRRVLSRLDIPPLAPIPADHVLTKSFYLLQEFPGRWQGGTVWVEADGGESAIGAARRNDGVSALVIGGNDWAAAWARDPFGRPLVPLLPGGERQRELAGRVGVNLVMYALTGNYKADQVHVPALLERLGQ